MKTNPSENQLLQLTYFFSLKIDADDGSDDDDDDGSDDDDDDDGSDDDNFRLNPEIVQDLIQHVQSFSDALEQLRNIFKDSFIGMYIFN